MQDNYSTCTYGGFYGCLPVERVLALRQQLAFHYTPKHGSWLNRTELEPAALSRQCLDRCIGSQQQLEAEALAWQADRNAAAAKVNWLFTAEKARD